VFRRDRNRVLPLSDAQFGPGDDFCSLWHILDLSPGGAGDWRVATTTSCASLAFLPLDIFGQ